MSSVKKLIETKIGSKKVVIFSKSYCPFCTQAKNILQEYIKSGDLSPDDYEVMELEDNPDMAAIQQELKKMTGASTVPRVFVKGTCLGGCDNTVAAHQSGKLKQLLAA